MRRLHNHHQRGNGAPLWLVLPSLLFVGCFFVLPLLELMMLSLRTRDGASWTVAHYQSVVSETIYQVTFARSIITALICTAVAIIVGYPLAYLIAHWPSPLRFAGILIVALPLVLNVLVSSFAWIVLLQRKGVINWMLMQLGLAQEPVSLLYTWPATISGMLYVVLPLMVLPVYSNLVALDDDYKAAARALGASASTVFWRITLPLSSSGLIAGALLVFISSTGLYLIPELLGGPSFTLFPFLIQQETLQFLNWPMAAALSIILVAIAAPLAVASQARLWNLIDEPPS